MTRRCNDLCQCQVDVKVGCGLEPIHATGCTAPTACADGIDSPLQQQAVLRYYLGSGNVGQYTREQIESIDTVRGRVPAAARDHDCIAGNKITLPPTHSPLPWVPLRLLRQAATTNNGDPSLTVTTAAGLPQQDRRAHLPRLRSSPINRFLSTGDDDGADNLR